MHFGTLRRHAWLTGVFVATRLFLQILGFRFNFELNWMFMCDPVDLRSRGFDCFYYFHAYPPGMNLLGSLLLKIGGRQAATLALFTFWAFGALLLNSLFYLLTRIGGSVRLAFAVAVVFSVIPQTLYFEHLYLYEHLVAAMLTAACACLYYAVEQRSERALVACFAFCAAIGWFRSTFHIVWFLAVVGVALFARGDLRRVLVAAAGPFALLLILYIKNAALFGVFATSSAAAANLTRVTLDQLDPVVKERWIDRRAISSLASISVFAGPAEYLRFFAFHVDGRSPILDVVERPTFHSPNFNHWVMLDVMRVRRDDAIVYLRERPFEYVSTVVHNIAELFGPATRWHPRAGKPGSPHYGHSHVLGAYERAYNRVLHAGPGIYVLLPFSYFWAGRKVARLRRSSHHRSRARAAVLAFALLQITYVVMTSALFTYHEQSRYRHQIEAIIWLLVAYWGFCLHRSWARRRPSHD